MSVKKADRTQSSFEVISNAIYMRGQFDLLFIRNLGIKQQDCILRLKYDIPINDEENKQEFVLDFLLKEKSCLSNLVRNINQYVIMANSIYPNSIEEYNLRREFQNRAISLCFTLTNELQYLLEVLNVNGNDYLNYYEMIKKEIVLIKGWRKSDNKFKKKFEAHIKKENN